jgi:mono/diheme cytochrome c family protein
MKSAFGTIVLAAFVTCSVACGENVAKTREELPERPAFCGRAHDAVSELFCGPRAAEIASLAELASALELDRTVFLAHSTALGGRLASSINPRAVLLRDNGFADGYVALTFTRGEQRAELVALDPDTERFNFYLLDFSQACNERAGGCTHGELFTPAIERDWRSLRVRDDEALKNTPLDCRRCHGGAPHDGGKPMLLMREADGPWLHWFPQATGLPSPLTNELHAAKQGEPYAGATMPFSPALLEGQVREAERMGLQARQPLNFLSGIIAIETKQFLTSIDYLNPDAAVSYEDSPTWRMLYEDYREGFGLPPPYHNERASDPTKLAAASAAYRDFLEGRIDRDELPDISDVLPDDQAVLAEMSFAVEPDARGETLVNQACGPCHNAGLDPTLSRARFDADLSRVSTGTLELARARLALDPDDSAAMPPPGALHMTAAQRRELRDYLAEVDPDEVTPRHDRVAEATEYALELGDHYESELSGGALALGDLNDDGKLDLAAGALLFAQRGDGTFDEPQRLPTNPGAALALVDVDRDGMLDLVSHGPEVAGQQHARGLVTYLAEGELRFSDPIASEGPTAADLINANFVDVDLDGEVDLVTRAQPSLDRVVVYLGDGTGGFTVSDVERQGAGRLGAMVLGDMTGDGLPDLIVSEAPLRHAIAIHAHDGVSGFKPEATLSDVPETVAIDLFLAIGDGNADGRNDLVLAPGIRLLLQEEDGELGAGPMIETNEGPTKLFDMNNDGRTDLVAFAQNLDEIRVLLQGARGLSRARSIAFALPDASGSARDTFEIRDLSGDGCPDVAVSRQGSVTVLYGTGCER